MTAPTDPPIRSCTAPEPLGHYVHARRAGHLLFLAGVGPRRRGSPDIPGVVLDAAGRVLAYDLEAQARACFDNARAILHDAGSSWERIIDVTVFLTDLPRDFAAFNRVWAQYFPADAPQPTRTVVGVTALPRGGNAPIAIELKIIASV